MQGRDRPERLGLPGGGPAVLRGRAARDTRGVVGGSRPDRARGASAWRCRLGRPVCEQRGGEAATGRSRGGAASELANGRGRSPSPVRRGGQGVGGEDPRYLSSDEA